MYLLSTGYHWLLVQSSLNDYPQAIQYYQAALALYRQLGRKDAEAALLEYLAGLYALLGKYARARSYRKAAQKL